MKIFSAFLLASFLLGGQAFAGKVEITTYYPAPTGEYQDLETSRKLKIPTKTVGSDATLVNPGEIWIEG